MCGFNKGINKSLKFKFKKNWKKLLIYENVSLDIIDDDISLLFATDPIRNSSGGGGGGRKFFRKSALLRLK